MEKCTGPHPPRSRSSRRSTDSTLQSYTTIPGCTQVNVVPISARVRDSKSYLDHEPRGVYRTEDFTTRKAERNRRTTAVRSRPIPPDSLCPSTVRPVNFRRRCQGPGNSRLECVDRGTVCKWGKMEKKERDKQQGRGGELYPPVAEWFSRYWTDWVERH